MDEELSEYATIRFTNWWSSIGLVHRPPGAACKLRPVVEFIYLGFRFLCLAYRGFLFGAKTRTRTRIPQPHSPEQAPDGQPGQYEWSLG